MRSQLERGGSHLLRPLSSDSRAPCIIGVGMIKVPVLMKVRAEHLKEVRAALRRWGRDERILPAPEPGRKPVRGYRTTSAERQFLALRTRAMMRNDAIIG